MSAANGHLPQGAKKLSIETLRAKARKWVKLPRQSEDGEDVYVCIRAIRQVDYMMLQPPPPPNSDTWPVARPEMSDDDKKKAVIERSELARVWYNGLPESEKWGRAKTALDVNIKVCLLALVDPILDEEAIRDLGDDVDSLATEILIFSGVIEMPKTEEKKDDVVSAPSVAQ